MSVRLDQHAARIHAEMVSQMDDAEEREAVADIALDAAAAFGRRLALRDSETLERRDAGCPVDQGIPLDQLASTTP
jgi:hypothetical protein